MLHILHSLRHVLIFVLALSVIAFAMGSVYLCVVAGRSTRNDLSHRGALNYMPLDLYCGGGALLITQLVSLAANIIYHWTNAGKDYNAGTLSLVSLIFLCVALILLGFLYAIATQLKMPGGYWFRHCFLYWLGKRTYDLLDLMPVLWKMLIPSLFGLACLGCCILFAIWGYYVPLMIGGAITLLIVCYCAYAFSRLLQGAKRMSQGNLNAKLDDRYLVGSYKECADYLNQLADVAIVAARKQMQSDRMKTELITNVSHDIKTPLTSIINYVDILQHLDSQEDSQQYLEVLGRQSQRLKKLIEDLMELSKASSGNMAVHILPLNVEETINQALGEFSDKLEQAGLELVFQPPEKELIMLADGRLSWRVLSNLFSNAVKYAMPGTRLYLELTKEDNLIAISLKNISREPLNIRPEELTERFVRGDVSRKTEGSGLGLNIAKSLMELQHGQLQLLVDGGVGHVGVAREVLDEYSLDIPLFGMVKDDYHKTRALTDGENEISIAHEFDVYTFVYNIQEEAHRFAVKNTMGQKRKSLTHSSLEKISGIGPAKAKKLLRAMPLGKIRISSVDELTAIDGVSKKDAEAIYKYYHKKG